ncbi:RNA-binding domain-containing protein [Linderina pennispora]|uniref:RNA-binding domain-containing protein n=1 Tax=Linderina pennispora TaxID=61395 RepID=A0A1Y1WIN9_9FUNG|nr:RNA-binding domain-containing protein [Linderina pennispora]ORX72964.1 RNA-binding domain-containing protein [Linderina pennispora]
MPAKKKGNKGQKMSLNDFLNDGPTTSSWADEDMELPSAPMAVAAPRSSLADAPDRKDMVGRSSDSWAAREPREPRGPVEFPTNPPFTSFVGNLPFSVDEDQLRDFFSGVTTVRLIRDHATERLKGFGYVEFETLEDLKQAVEKDGAEFSGRQIRVNVSEQREERARSGGARTAMPSGARRARRASTSRLGSGRQAASRAPPARPPRPSRLRRGGCPRSPPTSRPGSPPTSRPRRLARAMRAGARWPARSPSSRAGRPRLSAAEAARVRRAAAGRPAGSSSAKAEPATTAAAGGAEVVHFCSPFLYLNSTQRIMSI